MPNLTDYVVFNDEKLARKYEKEPIPVSVLYEAYFEGDIDITGDIRELLKHRHLFFKYTITRQHLQWAVTNFVPDMVAHTRNQDQKMVREVYDRGNDFFKWFLGDSMVYTAANFASVEEPLLQAQERQLATMADGLQLKPGERVLDVGCGWGTFVKYCAEHRGVDATGVTLAEKQTNYANHLIQQAGVADQARVLCQDYRDIESEPKYDKIICVEMIEHVGFKNLGSFSEQMLNLLEDDGLFLLQWTGLRRALKPEDLVWGLFMNKHIFPGADASLPPSSMLKTMEKAGFEIHSLENISGHYACTLTRWFSNWQNNREQVMAAYGERWFRIWNFFLAWSILIAEQGNAACYQAVLNKNIDTFRRARWIENPPDTDEADEGSTAPISEKRRADEELTAAGAE